MALIGKIRKNMWLVFIVIGFALAGFIVMDMVSASQQGGMATASTIGEVNGESIDYREFSSVESALFGGTGDNYGSKKATWDYMVEKALVTSEAESNGFNVPTEELKTLLFGANPAPVVRQMYTDPNTGQFDRNSLQSVRQAIEANQPLNASFQNRWMQIEKQVRAGQLQQKIATAVSKGLYTPTWMVEQMEQANNTNVDIALVRVPFDEVEEEMEVTEDDVKAFIAGKEDRFKKEKETRSIQVAVLDVIPTTQDSSLRRQEIQERIDAFATAPNDSLYALNNNGFYSPYYNNTEQLPEATREFIKEMEVGEVYGPYEDQGYYMGLKLIDKRNVPDSVEARHILRSTNPANGGVSEAEAQEFVDSLLTILRRDRSEFDSLAIKHSQDPGSSFKGGELGTFVQGGMVKPFNDAVFYASKTGDLVTVKTQFGIHLIDVQDVIYNDREDDYQVAIIRNPITPSDDTQEKLEGEMTDFVANNRTIGDLEQAIAGRDDIVLRSVGPFEENDFFITGLGSDQSSRDIIKWAFLPDLEIGTVSPELYTYTDNTLYFDSKYVIAALESINEPGMPSAAALQNELEFEILKSKRGKKLAEMINSTDLDAIASQFELQVDTVSNLTFSSATLSGIGNEPEVVASAYGMSEGSVSQPIVGNNGVYILKVIKKEPRDGAGSLSLTKDIMTNSVRSQATVKLMESIRKGAKISDGRSRFF